MAQVRAAILVRAFDERDSGRMQDVKVAFPEGVRLRRRDRRGRIIVDHTVEEDRRAVEQPGGRGGR